MIFVFGSNLAGRHGKGASLHARKNYGAIYGVGAGRQGNSYAIPTKDEDLKTLPLKFIKLYVKDFLKYARRHPELRFQVTRVGCGLAGYIDEDIAPMFLEAPVNCVLPPKWRVLARTMKRNNRVGKSNAQRTADRRVDPPRVPTPTKGQLDRGGAGRSG